MKEERFIRRLFGREREKEGPSGPALAEGIRAYLAAQGFQSAPGLAQDLLLCLKAKPFLLLAGDNGTGKTWLARLLPQALGAAEESGRLFMVSVEPDWSPASLGPVLEFVRRAASDLERPHFLCLDDFNLAQPDHYLGPLLTALDRRGLDPGPEGFIWPENLYLLATVSPNETACPLSGKILDRANLLLLAPEDLLPPREDPAEEAAPLEVANLLLRPDYLRLSQCPREGVLAHCGQVQALSRLLAPAGLSLGYRTRDEVVFYLLHNQAMGLLPPEQALDNQILSRILPRLPESGGGVREGLLALFRFCTGSEEDFDGDLWESAQGTACPHPKSAQRIARMVRRYEQDGFAHWG